jgi:hypothetical protein
MCVAVAGLATAVVAQPLADRLPAEETVLFTELDVGGILRQTEQAMAFVDPESGERITYQARQLYDLVLEFSENYEFHPVLFEDIADLRLFAVVLAKAEPDQIVHTYQVPAFDEATGEMLEGEFEDHTYTEEDRYTFSLIVQTSGGQVAVDFLDQFKGLIARLEEQDPEGFAFDRQDLEVEQGELVSDGEGQFTLGRLDEFVILSDGNPRELWAALVAGPTERMSDAPVVQGLRTAGPTEPLGMLTVNLETLLAQLEAGLREQMEEARAALEAEGGRDPANPQDWEGMQREMRVQMAETFYQVYQGMDRALSLGELRQVGFAAGAQYTDDAARGFLRGRLTHGENPSPLLTEIMEGAGEFAVPPVGEIEGMCYMVRVDAGRVFTEIMDALGEASPMLGQQYRQSQGAMRLMIGTDIGEILDQLAGDSYVFLDIVVGEREEVSFEVDEETGEWLEQTETITGPMPEISFLCGLKDPQAARALLNTIFTQVGASPEIAQAIRKRTYQEADVYCIGPDVQDDEGYPDGVNSFALVIVDRYLTFGGWDHVTGVIRQAGSGQAAANAELQKAIDANPDANLIVVIPKAFQERMEEMGDLDGDGEADAYDMLISQLEEADLTEALDPETADRARTALIELLRAVQDLAEKAQEMQPEATVLTGTHHAGYYEWLMETEARR